MDDTCCFKVNVDDKKMYKGDAYFILWAIDGGYPLCTKDKRKLHKPPASINDTDDDIVNCCSLKILPVQKVSDLILKRLCIN